MKDTKIYVAPVSDGRVIFIVGEPLLLETGEACPFVVMTAEAARKIAYQMLSAARGIANAEMEAFTPEELLDFEASAKPQ